MPLQVLQGNQETLKDMDPNMTKGHNLSCNCSIDDFKCSVYPVTYLVIFAVGLLGNTVSLYIFARVCKKWTSVNLYMMNLLISDLMLVCSLPFRVSYYMMDVYWVFGDIMCRVISYIFYINMYCSIYFLMVLSIMRYLAIAHPYKYVKLQTGNSAKVVCFVVWFFVALASTPLLSAGSEVDRDKIKCLELGTTHVSTIIVMNYVVAFVGFVVPFLVISFCYFHVVRSLLKPRDTQKKRPCYKKSTALVIIVLCIFLVCFLPYHLVRTLFLEAERQAAQDCESCDYIILIRKAAVLTLCLAAGNSCLDPLLFFFIGENFRGWWREKTRTTELKELNSKEPQ
ncbi:cysteinyl leukotriene receptor 2 [Amia ocellicauda]|uniref:cysteinyl leukotriene receptor 2 n=1 Tax=Amia ocellicauda TaxID=2972642 RepID=UPI003463D726